MGPEKLRQYLLLIAGLLLTACVVWYVSTLSSDPSQDAVLAYRNESRSYTTDTKQMEVCRREFPCQMISCI